MLAAFVAEPCAAPDGCNSFADKPILIKTQKTLVTAVFP